MQQAEEDVLRVSQTLDRLLALDSVHVELIPEKKGLFLKHVEYQVTSQASHPEKERRHHHHCISTKCLLGSHLFFLF